MMSKDSPYILVTATAKSGPPWRGLIRRADFKGEPVGILYGETEAEILREWADWLTVNELTPFKVNSKQNE